jgi:pimeloyl-ACP methyl ester carboxylesterase
MTPAGDPPITGLDQRRNSHGYVHHDAAPTQYVEADAIRFAYRRLGNPERSPLMFFHHFMGNHHDPALSDGSAADREVTLFINAGVASSTGLTPDTIEATARDAASFIDALGLTRVEILGHSMGGLVAQQVVLDRPELVRRLVLVGTGRYLEEVRLKE